MVRTNLFGGTLEDVEVAVIRYINDNLEEIVRCFLDCVDDGLRIKDFLPIHRLEGDEDAWLKIAKALYDIVKSDVIRDVLKPKYEYLLYEILIWWQEINEDEEVLLPCELDRGLEWDLLRKYNIVDDSDCGNYIVNEITDFEEYKEFLFEDKDFLLEQVDMFVAIYLKSKHLFEKAFPDIDLEEYRALMANDLRELYDESKQNKSIAIDVDEELFNDIIFCCERIQADSTTRYLKEDQINDRIRNLLEAKKYLVKDQTRQGVSQSGKESGEVDILIKIGELPISLIEAMKLNSVKKAYIDEHIKKIYNYDTLGYKYNYLISYVSTGDFKKFWNGYREYVCSYKYGFDVLKYDETKVTQYPEIKTIVFELDRNGVITKLYHILVHIFDDGKGGFI